MLMQQVELVGLEAVQDGVSVDFAELGEDGWVHAVGEDADGEERLAVDQRDAFVVELDRGVGGERLRACEAEGEEEAGESGRGGEWERGSETGMAITSDLPVSLSPHLPLLILAFAGEVDF